MVKCNFLSLCGLKILLYFNTGISKCRKTFKNYFNILILFIFELNTIHFVYKRRAAPVHCSALCIVLLYCWNQLFFVLLKWFRRVMKLLPFVGGLSLFLRQTQSVPLCSLAWFNVFSNQDFYNVCVHTPLHIFIIVNLKLIDISLYVFSFLPWFQKF